MSGLLDETGVRNPTTKAFVTLQPKRPVLSHVFLLRAVLTFFCLEENLTTFPAADLPERNSFSCSLCQSSALVGHGGCRAPHYASVCQASHFVD